MLQRMNLQAYTWIAPWPSPANTSGPSTSRCSMVMRMSTVADNSVSPVHMLRPLITRGSGLVYMAFTPDEKLNLILRMSEDPENQRARQPDTIAAPVFNDSGRVAPSLGLTFLRSASASQREANERFCAALKTASEEINCDLASPNRRTLA